LSRDHKPDCPDEKERILACNGRVASYSDSDGKSLGPARVWLKEVNTPGLAMSRSFGDLISKEVGVTAEPGKLINKFFIESFDHVLSDSSKFIVLGSDGLWEFLSNEDVRFFL
jgi:serine/threonine protein phosphatase PrpC